MFGLTPLGTLHTVLSVVALVAAGWILVRDGGLPALNRRGIVYLVSTALVAALPPSFQPWNAVMRTGSWRLGEASIRIDALKERLQPGANPPPAQERGPVIVCLDTSASMEGAPEQVAKALALEAEQTKRSPIAQWRNDLIEWIIKNNRESLKLIVLFGGGARDAAGGQAGTVDGDAVARAGEELGPLWAKVPHSAEDEIDLPFPTKAAEMGLPPLAGSVFTFDGAGRAD